ncbi:FtsX-like permease family protein [Nocardioides antri]|uniref:FtsX-like permease family protein n=1 Tax=Nocardioides antri TaxID=2607659 RepID=A0A5B1M7K8_9ACTN|nr:FtsX-like permease family protein [Nocardioides antri]KAA1429245.1 FtsX-like permease family protein [Nocardioides antri]
MRSRLLAGLWLRRGTHLTIALAVAVVAAGPMAVRDDGSENALLTPLVLLAAGLLPAAGLALGARRRHEAALLRLRGRRGASVARALVAEPLVPVLLGGAAGAALCWTVAPERVTFAVAVAGTAAVVVVAAMLFALREPLPLLLGDRVPRLTGGTGTRFLAVLVIVAAVVTVLRRDTDGSAWLPFAGPALVGLAGGVTATWLVRVVAGWLTGRPDLGAVLVGRRLQAPRATAGLPLVIAGATLLGLATNVLLAVQDWEDDTRAVTAGAPLVVPYAGDADSLLAATRAADPDGRWLMAALRVFADDRAVSRRVYLDTARYERVVGDHLDKTPAEEGSAAVALLHDAATSAKPEPTTTGNFLTATVASDSPRAALVLVSVTTDGVEGGAQQDLFLRVVPGESTTTFVPLRRCDAGCRVLGLEVATGRPCTSDTWNRPRCRRPVIRISRLNAGGLDLLDREWSLAEPDDRPPGQVTQTARSLEVRPSREGGSFLASDRTLWSVPVVATTSVDWEGDPQAPTTSSLPRPADVLRTVPALPLVGSGGTVLDLPTSTFEGGSAVAAAEPWILARADTPDDVIAAVGSPLSPEEISSATLEDSGSDLARRLLLVALGGLVLGVLGVLLPASRLRAERTREHAALRVLGVDSAELRRASRAQTVLVAVVAAVAGAAATAGAIAAFAPVVPALREQPAQLPLDTGVQVIPVLVAAGVVTIATLAAGAWASGSRAAASRPANLREEAAG